MQREKLLRYGVKWTIRQREQKNKDVKYVTRIVDDNTHVFEVYDVTARGEKQPTLKITYTRKM